MAKSPIQHHPHFSPTPAWDWPKLSSFALVVLVCMGAIVYGLLPGLLAVCLGYAMAHALAGKKRLNPALAAGIVILLPILGIALFLFNAKGMAFGAMEQYQALMHHVAETILQIRMKLPADIAIYLPNEPVGIQTWLADYLRSQSHALSNIGTAGLHGGLLVYVGLIVGALIVGSASNETTAPLRFEIRQRGQTFISAFGQIVVAQFWIAAFNATCTALFLLVALPLFGVNMPYVGALVAFTFVAGLIPIVGNLLCNGVLTLAGVSVSPAVAVACLVFLVAIHKSEIFINAKVVGKRTSTSTWELLAAMFVGEAVFGIPGLVAAPLFYAYAKQELIAARLI